MLRAIQNVIFLGYSGWATWFCYLTPSWPGFCIPHPLPTPHSAQLVSGCGAEERGLHNTQQERDRLGNRAPRDPFQLLWKESHGRSPPCPWRNHKWCWKSYKTKLLMGADVVNTGSTACSVQGEPRVLRTSSASLVLLWPPARCSTRSAHSHNRNRHKNNTFHS